MRYFETRKSRIEIIPMIDIMLFLLVFFVLISLRMIPASGIASNLPGSSTATRMPHPQVVVSLAADGTITLRGKTVTPARLSARLKQLASRNTRVTLAAASAASVQQLMRVMDACRRAGVTHIGIAARKDSRNAHGS